MKQINNRTKIIATIGPSSSDYDILKEMIKNGMFFGSHGSNHEWLEYMNYNAQLYDIKKLFSNYFYS